jgi:phosphopantothenoylcysteine synthetase/decarboxylase
VLNSPTAFGAEKADVTILGRDGETTVLKETSKLDIARKIVGILSSEKR